MKEQHRYNKTPEQGWASLKPILDKVMPEGKSGRRLPVFWWAASALIVAGLMSVLFINSNLFDVDTITDENRNHENSLLTDENDTKNLSDESLTVEAGVNDVTDEKIEENSSESLIRKDINNESSPDRKTNNDKHTPAANIKSKNIEQATIPMAALNKSQTNQIVSSADQSINTVELEENLVAESSVDLVPLDNQSVVFTTRDIRIIEPLFTLPIPIVSDIDLDREVAMTMTINKAKRNPSWFSPTLAASSLVGQNGGLGVYGGAGVDLNISRRFSLTTALGYAMYKPNANFLGSGLAKLSSGEINPIINFDPTSGLDNYVYSESINESADYAEINPLVETISQWQVDIGLNWRISRRFYASGGVKLGFGAEAFSQYPIVSGDPSVPSLHQIELGNSLSDYNVIRKSSTSMFFGLGYRLGQHFDVFANWTHGFDQYVLNADNAYSADLKQGERTDYIRGLSLGLKYAL